MSPRKREAGIHQPPRPSFVGAVREPPSLRQSCPTNESEPSHTSPTSQKSAKSHNPAYSPFTASSNDTSFFKVHRVIFNNSLKTAFPTSPVGSGREVVKTRPLPSCKPQIQHVVPRSAEKSRVPLSRPGCLLPRLGFFAGAQKNRTSGWESRRGSGNLESFSQSVNRGNRGFDHPPPFRSTVGVSLKPKRRSRGPTCA